MHPHYFMCYSELYVKWHVRASVTGKKSVLNQSSDAAVIGGATILMQRVTSPHPSGGHASKQVFIMQKN